MPKLTQSLQDYDLGGLRILATSWGLELNATTVREALDRLIPELSNPQLVSEILDTLSNDARQALDDLLRNGGRLPWPQFTRQYGKVREMGPGRRDREHPYLEPVSPAEILWYRALVARAFFDTQAGPEEFAYIPDDFLALISPSQDNTSPILGHSAAPGEYTRETPVSDRILDDCCTVLAALRMGFTDEEVHQVIFTSEISHTVLKELIEAADLLDEYGAPQPEPTRLFLEANRGESLVKLVQSWLESSTFNELRLVPGLSFEGKWTNNPLRARHFLLDCLYTIPENTWWSLKAFMSAIREQSPDFQRPAGDYDSWFIRDNSTGNYLRGFVHWDAVDGALIRFFITKLLHWLGILDLATPGPTAQAGQPAVSAFRWSKRGRALLEGTGLEKLPIEDQRIQVNSDASLFLPRLVPRAVRYQVARFCEWEQEREDGYHYHITPSSLERARQAGLLANHLLVLFRRHAIALPPNLQTALERWEQHGNQVSLGNLLVLRLGSPEILQELRASRASRFLGDPLGPTAIVVKPGAWRKVLKTLAEMGYLGEVDLGDPNHPS